MKANELMQGDLVLYEYNGEKIYARVVEIYRSSALVESVSKEYEPIEIAEDKLFPIPLIGQILEKNGFIPATNGVSWRLSDNYTDECLIMLDKIYNAFVMSTAGMTIGFQYVHQLQHALRLCGIEKEIEL